MSEVDLFGDEIVKDLILRDRFIEPPFSVLDTKTGSWQKRKRAWACKGIKSEVGRKSGATFGVLKPSSGDPDRFDSKSTSIFDPALC